MNFLVESNNYLMDFSYFFLLFSCGFILASIPVSILWNKTQMVEDEITEIPYEKKYSLENMLN